MSELSGLSELNLDPTITASSWSLRFTLQSDDGRWLHLSHNGLTSIPELARMITARQAEFIRREFPELRDLKLRKGLGK
jgi:hypothetical protein